MFDSLATARDYVKTKVGCDTYRFVYK